MAAILTGLRAGMAAKSAPKGALLSEMLSSLYGGVFFFFRVAGCDAYSANLKVQGAFGKMPFDETGLPKEGFQGEGGSKETI